ncbi:MAG: hypothetical protein J6Z14_14570 [Prevotella sp.]|nr:hypothetical protein [Prevotella sp.]
MNLSLRIYAIICLLLTQLRMWAQDDDEFRPLRDRGDLSDTDMDIMEGMNYYHPLHIDFSDILLIVLLIACCYVFGKIWKGCIYLLIAFAVLIYFLS